MKKDTTKKTLTKKTQKPAGAVSQAPAQPSNPPAAPAGECPTHCGAPMEKMPPDGRRSTNEGRRFRCTKCQRTFKRKLPEVARG